MEIVKIGLCVWVKIEDRNETESWSVGSSEFVPCSPVFFAFFGFQKVAIVTQKTTLSSLLVRCI